MNLDDLLVSYNQVIPKKFKTESFFEFLPSYELILSNIGLIRLKNIISESPNSGEPSIKYVIEEFPTLKLIPSDSSIKGSDEFETAYNNVEKENPQARKYRQFLTKMAKAESGFNKSIQNLAGAPAYGYFQFMLDGKKYNNISKYAKTDINTFRQNPELQIKAAIKLALDFEKTFSTKDLKKAEELGFTKFGLLGGAWLAGVGGVRKYLHQGLNLSDKHWSKDNKGTTVLDRIKKFNFRFGGNFKKIKA